MTKTIDQHAVDEKINRFLARKSPQKTLSETIADKLIPIRLRKRKTGISYETTRWSSGHMLHSH
jgi:hypothetical protein